MRGAMRFIYTMQYFLNILNMHLLAVALLAHPSGELLFMLLDRMLTMLATSAVFHASESQTESFYNYANQVTLKSHRSHSGSHSESHSESHNESHSESHSESQTESLELGELTR